MKNLENVFKGILIAGIICLVVYALSSCSRYISVEDAASGKARCGQHL